ncbi:hypothetical protein GCM10027168_01910 [Streptomyces capparidis]
MTPTPPQHHADSTQAPAPDHEPDAPELGTLVKDLGNVDRHGNPRVGRVVNRWWNSKTWLRPEGGGYEWSARPENLRPVPLSDQLLPPVAEANQQSRMKAG